MALLSVSNDLDETFNIDCQTVESLEICKNILNASKDNIKVLTYNIRSYQKNFDDFVIALNRLDSNIDVIVLTECWLSDGSIIEDLQGYSAYRTSKQVNKNGGIVVYTRTAWSSSVVTVETNLSDADSLLIKINNKLSLLAIYRSPSFINTEQFLNSLDTTLCDLKNQETIIVAGDINLNLNDPTNNQVSNYACVMASHGLSPAITLPTRCGACIDHIYIKSPTSPFGLVCDLSITDHDLALCSVPAKPERPKNTKRWRVRTDWTAVAGEITNTNWDPVTNTSCVNTALNYFNDIISRAADKHTQNIKISRRMANIQPWVTPGLIRCMRQRDKLHLECKANPDDHTKQFIYTRYRNFVYTLLRKLRNLHNRQEIEGNQKNPKKLWTAIKDICGTNSSQNSSSHLINSSISPTSSLDNCNRYFVSVGEKHAAKILDKLSTTHHSLIESNVASRSVSQSFYLHPTDEEEVSNIIRNLKIDSAPGPDQLTVPLLINCRESIIKPLTHIFNLSFKSGVFPDSWKIAAVSPIYKSGPKDMPENYRPIALLSIVSKMLEKIVNNRLINFVEKHNIVSERQFGFRRGRSAEDAVSLLTNQVAHHIENGECCIGVFLDLAKAFDTVSPGLLLKKLEAIGIRGTPLEWFRSYLTSRYQYCQIGSHRSRSLPIVFGVPQGSTLGPTLFTLYINDIVKLPLRNATIISYADDTAIVFHDTSWDRVYQQAEQGLSHIAHSLDANLLTLNVNKSKYIVFSKTVSSSAPQTMSLKVHTCRQEQHIASHLRYHSCPCTVLERTDTIKYLGIIIDNNLTYKAHIYALSSRVRKLIQVLKKLRDCTPIDILRMVYFALCQSIIQYCICIWGRAGKSTFITLERAQRALIKVALKKPFRYPTDLVYQKFQVLRVRQIFVLQATLKYHATIKKRPDYSDIINKRVFRVPIPDTKSELARRCIHFSHPNTYNKVSKICDLRDCSIRTCKKTLTSALLKLSYDDTEALI